MPPWKNIQAATLTCAVCSATFEAKRSEARYCSAGCRNKARTPRAYDAGKSKAWRTERLKKPGHREQVNAAANARIRAVKQWIADYKTSAGCVDCGYNAHPAALDIDHMDGKTANISSLKSIAAVQAEIRRHRCVVRCANCHRIKSWETRTWERHDASSTSS